MISNNSSKPGRKTLNTIIALTSNKWADKNLETLLSIINYKVYIPVKCKIHKWRYVNIGKNTKYKYLSDKNNKLAAMGNWYISGYIESAFLSANDLYKKFCQYLSYDFKSRNFFFFESLFNTFT